MTTIYETTPHIKSLLVKCEIAAHIIEIWEETWRIYAAFMSGHRKIPLTCGYLVAAAAYERVKKCACVISLSIDGSGWCAHTRIYWSFVIFFHGFHSHARYLYILLCTSCDVHMRRGTYKNIILSHAVLYEMGFH